MTSSGFLGGLPVAARVFVGLFLVILGLTYLALLAGIYEDTQMKVSLIAEAYRSFTWGEWVRHVFTYLTWFAVIFGALLGAFLFSSHTESIKVFWVIWVFVWTISDIAAAWLIRYSDFFAYQLFGSGFILAMTFATLFVRVQRELWFVKKIHG